MTLLSRLEPFRGEHNCAFPSPVDVNVWVSFHLTCRGACGEIRIFLRVVDLSAASSLNRIRCASHAVRNLLHVISGKALRATFAQILPVSLSELVVFVRHRILPHEARIYALLGCFLPRTCRRSNAPANRPASGAAKENQSGQAHQQTVATLAGRGVADGKARSTGVLLSSAGHCLVFRGFL
jgi:hypothetical protein